MKRAALAPVAILFWMSGLAAHAKTFQNSYVAFEVPDNWACVQEGVAWTCTPLDPIASKEAVIVLAAKVAGPEDTLQGFLSFLKQPKKIVTKVGTPMPSEVMSAEQRTLSGQNWIQAQHLGSEIQDYYTLYLATVKDHLAILVSFSAEKTRYKVYNPIFDKAVRSLRIVASNQLLFPKSQQGNTSDIIGIQVPNAPTGSPYLSEFTEPKRASRMKFVMALVIVALLAGAYIYWSSRKKISRRKKGKHKSK